MQSKTSTMKTELFKRAWTLFKDGFGTFAECLRQAWKVIKLKSQLNKGGVAFKFMKKDGTVREAIGTLLNVSIKGSGRPTPLNLLAYFDTDKESFRSFKIENLI